VAPPAQKTTAGSASTSQVAEVSRIRAAHLLRTRRPTRDQYLGAPRAHSACRCCTPWCPTDGQNTFLRRPGSGTRPFRLMVILASAQQCRLYDCALMALFTFFGLLRAGHKSAGKLAHWSPYVSLPDRAHTALKSNSRESSLQRVMSCCRALAPCPLASLTLTRPYSQPFLTSINSRQLITRINGRAMLMKAHYNLGHTILFPLCFYYDTATCAAEPRRHVFLHE